MTPTLQEIIKPVISAEAQFPAGSYEHSELVKDRSFRHLAEAESLS